MVLVSVLKKMFASCIFTDSRRRNLEPSVQAIVDQTESVNHQFLSHFSHKDVFGLDFLNRGKHKVRDGMSYTPEVFTYRQVGVLMASLNHTVPVATEPLLCTLPCFTTVLSGQVLSPLEQVPM